MDIQTILCIPGNWADRNEIVTALAAANPNEYLFAGSILLHVPTGDSFEVKIAAQDTQMQQSFTLAGQGRLTDEALQAIGAHRFVVYVIGKGGDLRHAEKIMQAGNAFLKAGGLGIKVETTGKAFSNEQWQTLAADSSEQALYEAFVVLLRSEEEVIYSCGMHNIGFRDVVCDINTTVQQAAELADIFNIYQVLEKPQVASGQTFGIDAESDVYTITSEDCTIYPPDDLFYNPYGMFRLQAV